MKNIIAIFDNEAALERALSAIGDRSIEDENPILVSSSEYRNPAVPGGAGAAVFPGAAPARVRPEVIADPDNATQDTLSALSERFGDMVQNRDQLAYYAEVVERDGHLLAVRVPKTQVGEVSRALQREGATHIDSGS